MRVFVTKMHKYRQMLRFRAVDLSYKAGLGRFCSMLIITWL